MKLLSAGPVSTGMGEHLQVGRPSWYVTSHPGQVSQVIPSWLGTVSTSKAGCKWAHHAMHCGLTVSASVWLRATGTKITAVWLGKDCALAFFTEDSSEYYDLQNSKCTLKR